MQYRTFGKTNLKVSSLGYGCMRLPVLNGNDKEIDEEEAIRLIRYSIDHGVTYVDTAYPYHGGNSEIVVGKALKDGYRQKINLATKCPTWLIKSNEDFDKYLDEQLKKLDVDYIDMYLLHALSKDRWENLLNHNVFEFLDRALKQGKIKHAGFSFHDDLDTFKKIVDSYGWDFCQIQYNYMDENYQAGKEGLQYAAAKGMAVVIMEPLKGGKLANPPKPITEVLEKAGKDKPAAWGLKWLLNQPEVTVILSGMNSQTQIDENIKTATEVLPGSLDEIELGIINFAKDKFRELTRVDCTGCGYCMPCPAGVNIPGNFSLYNRAFMYNDIENCRKQYSSKDFESKRASKCRECGKCEKVCPQHLSIRKFLKEANSHLNSRE